MRNEIQINQKLMEREELLVDVFDLERRINGILGGEPYPLAAPADLPSRQKRKKPKRKAAPKKPAAVRVRKLDPETEAAYRVAYRDRGEERVEIHFDPRPIALLLNTPLPHLQIARVETVGRADDGVWKTAEILFDSPAAPEAS